MRLRRAAFALIPAAALVAGIELFAQSRSPALPPDDALGWTMQANLDGYRVDPPAPQLSFSVDTNADGLRTTASRERDGRTRVLTFGDSTVFGWGVGPEDAPPGRLQALLGNDYEVINAGQPGYSSEQARRLAERLIPLYQPDGVVWFHPWHDVAGATVPDRDLLPLEPRWWTRSAALRLLAGVDERARPALPALHRFTHTPRRDGPQRVPASHRRDNIRRLSGAAEGIWLVLVQLPSDASLRVGGVNPQAVELQETAESLGHPFVDPTHTVEGSPLEELTLPGDAGHWQASASERMMVPVADAVRAQRTH